MSDRVDVGKVLKDIKVGNNGVSDGAGNQDNRRTIVKDLEDFDNRVTIAINPAVVYPTDRIFADILVHFFGLLSPQSNLPPDVTATYSS